MSGRLFSFYGDDFTGSTDALEALAANAVPSVLFLDPPEERMLERFGDCRAIGVAGESRSRSPEWMSENLPEIFRGLRRLGAQLCQYKVCSTFDSSPQFGSIGRALEIGQQGGRDGERGFSAGSFEFGRRAAFEPLAEDFQAFSEGIGGALGNFKFLIELQQFEVGLGDLADERD